MQYSRSDLEFHADVACLWVQSDLQRAAIAGPVETVQVGTAGGPYVWVTLKEGGTSSGDELRVVFESTLPTESEHCGVSSTTPGVYTDGNVNIRSK